MLQSMESQRVVHDWVSEQQHYFNVLQRFTNTISSSQVLETPGAVWWSCSANEIKGSIHPSKAEVTQSWGQVPGLWPMPWSVRPPAPNFQKKKKWDNMSETFFLPKELESQIYQNFSLIWTDCYYTNSAILIPWLTRSAFHYKYWWRI